MAAIDDDAAADLRDHFAARIGKPVSQPADAMEMLEQTIGTLDITNEEVDFREIDVLMSKFQEDPRVQEALEQGMDMREYAKQIDQDLLVAEKDSIGDYIKESENLAQLHHQLKGCDSILERMESLLNGFQADLGNISDEIRFLQDQSSSMSVQLQNRKLMYCIADMTQAVADSLSSFIMDIAIEPKLVKSICANEMNESYIEYLTVLNNKIGFSKSLKDKKILACHDVDPELEKLRVKAVTRVREFLLQMIYNLKRPNTNVQILQQSKLLKYKYLYRFLYSYGKEYALEAREAYVETLQKVFHGYFREYIAGLMRVRADIGSKADLIGVPESQMKSFFSSRIAKSTNVFSLGDPSRADLLADLEAPYIVLGELQVRSVTHPYEVLFRSMNHYFKDAVTSEHFFDLEFFGKGMDFFQMIFGRSTVLFLDNLTSHLASCYDVIGILLMIRITNHNKQIVKARKVTCLDDYYQKSLNLLWPRYNIIFNMHLESVRNADPRSLGSIGTLPHYITRRYAEFSAAIHTLSTEADQSIGKGLVALRNEVAKLLNRLAASHTKPKQKMIFLINNFDHILTIYESRGIEGADVEWWKAVLEKQVTRFVEDELRLYYAEMLQFVATYSAQLSEEGVEATKAAIDEAQVAKLVKHFSSNWKQDIALIYNNVLKFFPNFMSGARILQQLLTQLALHYTGFEDVVRACYANKYAKDFVPRPTLTYEIKKYSTNF